MKLVTATLVSIALLLAAPAAADQFADDSAATRLGGGPVIADTLTASSPTYSSHPHRQRRGPGLQPLRARRRTIDVHYGQHCIKVLDSQPIEAIVNDLDTTIGDTTMTLYCDPWRPADPHLKQLVSYDDDGDGSTFLSAFFAADNITLTPGLTYWLVLTTFNSGETGTYRIDLSPNIELCATPVEPTTWGQIKATYR